MALRAWKRHLLRFGCLVYCFVAFWDNNLLAIIRELRLES
jgi:hypothetical protein